jgi:hypothetical protein
MVHARGNVLWFCIRSDVFASSAFIACLKVKVCVRRRDAANRGYQDPRGVVAFTVLVSWVLAVFSTMHLSNMVSLKFAWRSAKLLVLGGARWSEDTCSGNSGCCPGAICSMFFSLVNLTSVDCVRKLIRGSSILSLFSLCVFLNVVLWSNSCCLRLFLSLLPCSVCRIASSDRLTSLSTPDSYLDTRHRCL